MKKIFMPLFFTVALSSCDPLTLGDDIDIPCTIDTATHGPCSATDPVTKQTKFFLLRAMGNCDYTLPTPIGVTVTAPGGIRSYKLVGSTGQALEDEFANNTIQLEPNSMLSGGIETALPGAIPTVKVWKIDDQGNKIILESYSLDECPREPACENKITGACSTLSNINTDILNKTFFEVCRPFSADLCFLTSFPLKQNANIQRQLTNTETGQQIILPNGGWVPNGIRIHFPAGKRSLSVTARAKSGTQIPVNGQVKIHMPNVPFNQTALNIWGINDAGGFSIITQNNDANCTN